MADIDSNICTDRGVGWGIHIMGPFIRKPISNSCTARVRRDGYPVREEVDGIVMEERVGGANVWVLSDS